VGVGLRLKRAILVMAVVSLTAVMPWAQTDAESRDKCSLTGTVLDTVSKQPVRDAAVSLRSLAPLERFASRTASSTTDSSGRFSFNNLPAGRYSVLASHEGYVGQGSGRRGPLARTWDVAPGQHLDDVVVYLMPGGIISGLISNAGGKPLSGVTLQALKRTYRFGTPEFDEVSNAVTNQAGEYQLTALAAGDYYLRAIPQQPQAHTKDLTVFVPTYFPGTIEPSRSTLLVLRAAEQLSGVDMTLSRARVVVVTGRVVDAVAKSPGKGTELTLLEEGNIAPVPYSATADAKGTFELKGVPPGHYLLVAEKPYESERYKSMWGQKPIQVGDSDVRNLEVALNRGVEVSGRIVLDSKASVDLTRLTGILELQQTPRMRGFTPDVENATVSQDGSFVFREVPDGNYRINFFPIPSGFYLKAVRSPDVLDTGVTVRGQPVQALELSLSSGVARLEGTIVKDQQPSAATTVVLVPNMEHRGQPRYYRQTFSDGLGRFVLQDVIPGDYEVFAWQDMERGSYMDPDLLRQFEDRGQSVTLKEGTTLKLQLEAIPLE